MKISQIIVNESMGGTTAGAVATVESPMGGVQKRNSVKGLEPVEKVMTGKTKKKGPYQNSLSEGKKDFAAKIAAKIAKSNKDKKDTEEKVKQHQQQQKDKVDEAKLDEDDIIVVPGQGIRRKTGFVPHGQSRVDHEVEMARSDVLATMKNAKAIYKLLQDRSEDEGIEGWVQEKLIKANDYLNAVKEYYDEKMMQEMTGGVIAGGGVGESVVSEKAVSKAQQRFMGMAHAIQKGKKIPGASKELKDVAKGMSKKAGHEFAATKHKGLPEKVKKKD